MTVVYSSQFGCELKFNGRRHHIDAVVLGNDQIALRSKWGAKLIPLYRVRALNGDAPTIDMDNLSVSEVAARVASLPKEGRVPITASTLTVKDLAIMVQESIQLLTGQTIQIEEVTRKYENKIRGLYDQFSTTYGHKQ